MEFTFYGKKVASDDEPLSEKRKSSERPSDELPSADICLELHGPQDVHHPVTIGHESQLDMTDEAAKRQGVSDVMNPVTDDHEGIRDVTDSAINNQSSLGIQDVADEVHGEQTEIFPVAFNDYGSTENVSFSTKEHEESGVVATNALQETLGTAEDNASPVAVETPSLTSTTEEDQSQSTLTTAGASSQERIKTDQGKKNFRRKKGKKKKKKGDGASEPEEEGMEIVYDSAVFHISDDVKRKDEGTKGGKRTADKGRVPRPSIRVEAEQPTAKSTVDDSISPNYMFKRRSKHARANFPNLEKYLLDRQNERKREMCNQKVNLMGAVLIMDTCISAFNWKTSAEIEEELDEIEAKQLEQRQSTDYSLQIKNVDQKISLSNKEAEKGKRNTQTKQNENLKSTEKYSLLSEKEKRNTQTEQNENLISTEKYSLYPEYQQHDVDKESTILQINPTITIEDASRRISDKDIDEQTKNSFVRARSESRKTTRRTKEVVPSSDKSRLRENKHSVPTRVAIGQLGRSLTTWIINDPTKWRTKPKETETETLQKCRCDVKMTASDFALVTEFPSGSSSDELTDDANKLDAVRTSTQLEDSKRKESAKQSLRQSAKGSRTSYDYARRSKAVLEQLQRTSAKKAEVRPEKVRSSKVVEEVKQTAAKKQQQPQKKWKKAAERQQPPPTIKVETLRRSQINEWDVDEEFLSHLLEATDRFEVRKECVTFISDKTQTLHFVTFTRPLRSTYC